MKTEQALIAMIQNPGKKFTNGHEVAYYEGASICLEISSVPRRSLYDFLKAFGGDTWTEHKEPRVVELKASIKFDNGGYYISSNLHKSIRESLGGMSAVADAEFDLDIKATEVL